MSCKYSVDSCEHCGKGYLRVQLQSTQICRSIFTDIAIISLTGLVLIAFGVTYCICAKHKARTKRLKRADKSKAGEIESLKAAERVPIEASPPDQVLENSEQPMQKAVESPETRALNSLNEPSTSFCPQPAADCEGSPELGEGIVSVPRMKRQATNMTRELFERSQRKRVSNRVDVIPG